MGIGGHSNGMPSSSGLRVLYSLIKDSIPTLAADGLTQSNPSIVTAAAKVSSTLPANTKKGVLGGSVAFTRPAVGANVVGGAQKVGGNYTVGTRPLGLFLNDAVGNSFENTPAVASGKCPHLRGGAAGVKIYETVQQIGADTALTYAIGDKLYASVNGLLTNRWQDSYEYQWINGVSGSGAGNACIEPDVTCLGTVLAPPDATTPEMFVSLKLV